MTENAPTVTIRLAQAGDAEIIHAGLQALARSMDAEARMQSTIADIRRHGFGEARAFEVVIAECSGDFAGFCLTFPSFSTWRGELGIYVQDLYVDPAFRRHGVGERLLRAAARRGAARGAAYLRLSVDVANLGAQAFYERVGITHSRDEQIHMIKGEAFSAFAAGEAETP
jgi:ribosomal protein S18 acetylase RimI-like enzyme